MTAAALSIALLLHQLGTDDAGTSVDALEESRVALDEMRELLRSVEHGLQEANDLGDTRAFDCVKTGQPAIAHQVESAEQWNALLKDAVANQDAEITARLLSRIAEARREVQRRASDLSTCKLNLEPPAPVLNRSWFGCDDVPPSAANPEWRSCERRRSSAVTFGLGGLLVAMPVASAIAVNQRGIPIGDYGGLALESAVGGLIGGLALFTVTGAIALAATGGFSQEGSAARFGPAVGICAGLGVGAGAIISMWLDRPDSGAAAPIAAAVSYVVLAGLSAFLIAVHDHFSVATFGDEPSLAERSFAFAPALMALSGMITLPAVWSVFARR